MKKKLTHLNSKGNLHMVDTGGKKKTARCARASGLIFMKKSTLEKIKANEIKKGEVLSAARTASILASKQTPFLIPLTHPVQVTGVECEFLSYTPPGKKSVSYIEILTEVKCHDRTGAEIEALFMVEVAALTIYDMCKSVDRGMIIGDIRLVHKSGGKSGTWNVESGRGGRAHKKHLTTPDNSNTMKVRI